MRVDVRAQKGANNSLKPIKMFMKSTCPYCMEARRWMNVLIAENEKYKSLEITMVDENVHPDIAAQYDYYYVPTYYVGDEKVHEGAANREKVKRVFDLAAEQ